MRVNITTLIHYLHKPFSDALEVLVERNHTALAHIIPVLHEIAGIVQADGRFDAPFALLVLVFLLLSRVIAADPGANDGNVRRYREIPGLGIVFEHCFRSVPEKLHQLFDEIFTLSFHLGIRF